MGSGGLQALTPREASIFACLVDAVVAPEPLLPGVAQTDCTLFFDRWMAAAPRVNARGLRALLHAVELMPYALGFRARLRRLPVAERARFLAAVEHSSNRHVRQLVKLLKGVALLSYYGDDAVMAQIGYDAAANLRRGRELRAREGRP